MDLWTSPGLFWCDPPPCHEDDEVDPDEVAQRVAAVEAQAYMLNRSAKAYGQAIGNWVDDDDGTIGGRVLAAVEQRFVSVPRLGCEHYAHDEARVFWLYEGPIPAAVCDRPDCLDALDRLVEATAAIPYCALCIDRSPWLETIEAGFPLPWGRVRVLVHSTCLHP